MKGGRIRLVTSQLNKFYCNVKSATPCRNLSPNAAWSLRPFGDNKKNGPSRQRSGMKGIGSRRRGGDGGGRASPLNENQRTEHEGEQPASKIRSRCDSPFSLSASSFSSLSRPIIICGCANCAFSFPRKLRFLCIAWCPVAFLSRRQPQNAWETLRERERE